MENKKNVKTSPIVVVITGKKKGNEFAHVKQFAIMLYIIRMIYNIHNKYFKKQTKYNRHYYWIGEI